MAMVVVNGAGFSPLKKVTANEAAPPVVARRTGVQTPRASNRQCRGSARSALPRRKGEHSRPPLQPESRQRHARGTRRKADTRQLSGRQQQCRGDTRNGRRTANRRCGGSVRSSRPRRDERRSTAGHHCSLNHTIHPSPLGLDHTGLQQHVFGDGCSCCCWLMTVRNHDFYIIGPLSH